MDRESRRNFHRFTERPEEYRNSLAYYRMGMMGTTLVQDMGIQYNPKFEEAQRRENLDARTVREWDVLYSDSRAVFLHGLLAGQRHGTCSSMPFLYAAIGRRLGYRVNVAARKYHLYVRYEEENGDHLNMEATENQGFATPSDAEYRDDKLTPAMTEEEIHGCGWLRPLSNKETLGLCLTIRAWCLRSMKRYDEEIATLEHARRYVPQTPMMRQVIEANQTLAKNLRGEDRCNELCREIQNMRFPTGGPMCEYFRNKKAQIQLFMNQATNATEVEACLTGLIRELNEYRARLSDFPDQLAEAFSPANRAPDNLRLPVSPREVQAIRRVRLPEERVPMDYWERMPAELMDRLRKLGREEHMIVEMHVYAAEELQLHNLATQEAATLRQLAAMSPGWQQSRVRFRPEDLPQPWRGRQIPPELHARLAYLAKNVAHPAILESQNIKNELDRFFLEQDQRQRARAVVQTRRKDLNPEPAKGPPLQIEIVRRMPDGNVVVRPLLPLTSEPQYPISPVSQPVHGRTPQ